MDFIKNILICVPKKNEVVVPDLDHFAVSYHFANFSYFHTNKYDKYRN